MRNPTDALIVIDVQNDFCPGGKLAVKDGNAIIPRINALMDEFETVVLTQDWHPANHASFADNHEGAAPFSVVEMPYGMQVLWPAHCVIDSEGAAFHPDLATEKADHILRKGFRPEIDSYSAFFENDRKTATGLETYLREKNISRLTFVGLATDFCVAWSAQDAVRLGFDATVLLDATRAIDLDGSLADAKASMIDVGVILEN